MDFTAGFAGALTDDWIGLHVVLGSSAFATIAAWPDPAVTCFVRHRRGGTPTGTSSNEMMVGVA